MRISRQVRAILWQVNFESVRKSVAVRLSWTERDPLVVRMAFKNGKSSPVHWDIARDLLNDGLSGNAGEGDVHIQYVKALNSLSVELFSPSGYAEFLFDVEDTTAFIEATTDLVPIGSEVIQIPDRIPKYLLALGD